MGLTLRNVVVNSIYYGVTVGALPSLALWLEPFRLELTAPLWPLQALGALLGLVGVVLQLWGIVVLQTDGRGSPSPLVPTRQLVTRGPYAWVRNPINIGEILVFLALSVWFTSWMLLAYALLSLAAFHWFIVRAEEPRHERLFGDRYLQYRARVPRWWPVR